MVGRTRDGFPSNIGFQLVDASFDGASSTTLRFDQMLDARFWRIGFTFETLDLAMHLLRR